MRLTFIALADILYPEIAVIIRPAEDVQTAAVIGARLRVRHCPPVHVGHGYAIRPEPRLAARRARSHINLAVTVKHRCCALLQPDPVVVVAEVGGTVATSRQEALELTDNS